ncbi:MAG: hypothetical protein M1814_005196 [Vezdaea aestivalis]|nr:MAG: hypothetical protein M1814_005196 [Vezdaea aestivalis]
MNTRGMPQESEDSGGGQAIRRILEDKLPLIRFFERASEGPIYPPWLNGCDCTDPDLEPYECDAHDREYEFVKGVGKGSFGVVSLYKSYSPTQTTFVTKEMDNSDHGLFYRTKTLPPMDNPGPGRLWDETANVWMLRGAPRVSKLHQSFTHGDLELEVYHLLGENAGNGEGFIGFEEWNGRDYSHVSDHDSGGRMKRWVRKETVVDELDTCKITSQLLQAFIGLQERQMLHNDLSHRNYIVDDELNVELIDFGNSGVCLEGYMVDDASWVIALENMETPELALTRQQVGSRPFADLPRHGASYDGAAEDMWRFGVVIYELLHGHGVFENPDPAHQFLPLPDVHLVAAEKAIGSRGIRLLLRRRVALIEDDLYVRDGLSQDCVDALQCLFIKHPKQRPRTEELSAFPWLSNWYLDTDHEFVKRESTMRNGPLNRFNEVEKRYELITPVIPTILPVAN